MKDLQNINNEIATLQNKLAILMSEKNKLERSDLKECTTAVCDYFRNHQIRYYIRYQLSLYYMEIRTFKNETQQIRDLLGFNGLQYEVYDGCYYDKLIVDDSTFVSCFCDHLINKNQTGE